MTRVVLILGSAPNAVEAQDWDRGALDEIVAINNAWRMRDDWDVLIHPEDFPVENQPPAPTGRVVRASEYVPVQNRYGGFVYAGGTMAFTAGYWALGALRPDVMAFFGCDMVYAPKGNTHFYGTGAADPLRKDVTLRNLEAKSARLMLLAAAQGCACVNLSARQSRLVFPRATLGDVALAKPRPAEIGSVLAREQRLGYMVPSGRYWEEEARFDTAEIDALDQAWLDALGLHAAA
jgi:hypothetical protein